MDRQSFSPDLDQCNTRSIWGGMGIASSRNFWPFVLDIRQPSGSDTILRWRFARIRPAGKVSSAAKVIIGAQLPLIDCTAIDYSAGGTCLQLSAVEPTRSTNITVRWRRSASGCLGVPPICGARDARALPSAEFSQPVRDKQRGYTSSAAPVSDRFRTVHSIPPSK